MMKRMFILSVVLLVVSSTFSAWALDIAGFGSYSNTSDIGDAWGLGAKVDLDLGSLFLVEARASYFPEYKKEILDQDVKFKALPLELGLGVRFSYLFASAGLSYFVLDSDKGDIDSSAGFYLSGGFKTGQPKGGFGVYGDVLYRILTSTVTVKDDEITIGKKDVDLNGFGINLGIVFRF